MIKKSLNYYYLQGSSCIVLKNLNKSIINSVICSKVIKKLEVSNLFTSSKFYDYINPTDPAVKPTAKKNVNSNKSLGREFTIKFI